MKLLSRKEIDIKKWDERIASSQTENIFCYSWYLDSVSENWSAVISENYATVAPIPFSSKLGVKQLYNAPFCREYDIFGTDFSWHDLAEFLKDNFRGMQFRNRKADLFENFSERKHQELTLDSETEKGFKTNAKRLIKRGQKFMIEKSYEPSKLIDIFKKTAAQKIDSINDLDLQKLESLMTIAIENGHGELFLASDQEEIQGAAFFLKDKKRITYLKGASFEQGKKDGVMYALIAHGISIYKNEYDTFDFGGSEIEGVANFFKKFGASDRIYYNYEIDHLPKWFKALKKLKP